MKKIFTLNTGKNWWQGEIVCNYNLYTWVKILALIIAIPFAIVYLLGVGLWQLLRLCGRGIKTTFAWLSDRLHRSSAPVDDNAEDELDDEVDADEAEEEPEAEKTGMEQPEQPNNGREDRNIFWLAAAIVLLIIGFCCWKGCSSQPQEEPDYMLATAYEKAFDKVVVARAYLDGVQTEVDSKCPRALVGFKFINGQPVKDFDFEGMTYDQAVKVVAEDWKPLVTENLNPEVKLTEQEMAVVTLAAMRMGKYGFARSTFLQKINEGKLNEAGEWLLLQKADGSIRNTGDEPKQYFYVLRMLWEGNLTIEDLLDYPMFSYKNIDMGAVTTYDGKTFFNSEVYDVLEKGNFATPREVFELWPDIVYHN